MNEEQTNVRVVPLAVEHLPAVAELERLCFAEPWSEHSLRMLTEAGALGAVVLLQDRVVAYGGMTTVLDEGAVTNVAVHPDARGQGFGKRVTEALLAYARSAGARTVFLEVRESNLVARHLYESLGFRACGVRKNFYRHPTESAIQMRWTDKETKN